MVWRRGRAYSQDLRGRVLAADGSARAVAARFGVSVSYVVKARQRRDRTGQTTAGAQRLILDAFLLRHPMHLLSGVDNLITLSGDHAKIDTIKDGCEGPVSLAQVGDTVYVLDVPLKYLFDEKMKGQKPPPFKASPVKLPQ